MELTRPIIQLFLAQVPALASGPQEEPALSGMPSAWGKLRFAPLDPVFVAQRVSQVLKRVQEAYARQKPKKQTAANVDRLG